MAPVVHHDNFILPILLLKQHRDQLPKVLLLIVGTYHHRYRHGQPFCAATGGLERVEVFCQIHYLDAGKNEECIFKEMQTPYLRCQI